MQVALRLLITNLHHTLNPSDIVIGGPLSRLPGPLLPTALEFFTAHQHRLFNAVRPVHIVVGTTAPSCQRGAQRPRCWPR